MKVALVCGRFPPLPCGVGDHAAHLACALAARGCRVEVITRKSPSIQEWTPHFAERGVTVLPMVSAWNRAGVASVVDRLRADSPEVVHLLFQTAVYDRRAWILSLPRQAHDRGLYPVVVTAHDLWGPHLFPGAGRTPLRRQFLRRMLTEADRVLVSNERHREELASLSAVARGLIVPLGPGLPPTGDADARTRGRRGLQANDDQLLVGHFGLLQPGTGKGVDDLLRCFGAVAADRPSLRLVFIGGVDRDDDPYLMDLRREAEALGLSSRVMWTGRIPFGELTRASDLLSALDVCVLPFEDGVALHRSSFISALCHRLAVLTTVSGAAPSILEHGRNVWLCPAGDGDALARGLAQLVDDSELRSRLQDGAGRLATRFTWQSVAESTLAAYKQAAKGRIADQ